MDKVLPGVTEIVHELAGGISGGTDAAYAIMTTDTVPKQAALHHDGQVERRRNGQGCGHARPVAGDHARACSPPTPSPPPSNSTGRCARPLGCTFDRLDVDGAAPPTTRCCCSSSGASGVTPAQDELDAAVLAVCDDLAEQLMADAEGVTKRVQVTVTGAATEDDALIGRPHRRPRQPGQDRAVRLRPQLGPGPRRGRHRSDRARPGPDLGVVQRRPGLRRRRRRAGRPRRWTCRGTDIAVDIDLGVGDAQADIRTTDLSHGYVEENSAYSS